MEKIKVKKDFQKIIDSQINFELNSTVTVTNNTNYMNTENSKKDFSERKNYISNLNTIDYGNNNNNNNNNGSSLIVSKNFFIFFNFLINFFNFLLAKHILK